MIRVKSPAFGDGQEIPKKYTQDGGNISPPLSWSGLPKETKELALICEDANAGSEPAVHWVIYKIPPSAAGLAEAIDKGATPNNPPGTLQGQNSFHKIGYSGPTPPPGGGVHHYHFRVYALKNTLPIGRGLSKKALQAAMQKSILDQGDLVGIYKRK